MGGEEEAVAGDGGGAGAAQEGAVSAGEGQVRSCWLCFRWIFYTCECCQSSFDSKVLVGWGMMMYFSCWPETMFWRQRKMNFKNIFILPNVIGDRTRRRFRGIFLLDMDFWPSRPQTCSNPRHRVGPSVRCP